ncbi:hypothetical protein ALC57_15312 [Trachymyrmex cornetzi]|uniref:Uncharacterized protein n=1 Tax=Trachymyrmex cornetzi TaxID=471704 RepID=A0A195DI64_9HYME|nr:hypothetical protein ALC57_15312 [Trachymyrmex cornetzi]
MKDATGKRGRNADAPSEERSKRAGEIEGESCGECTEVHTIGSEQNVVTSGPLSCGGGSRFTLGAVAGTENHDCRVARERRCDEMRKAREKDRQMEKGKGAERGRNREKGEPREEKRRRGKRRGERTSAYRMHIEASFHGHRRLKVPT